VDFDVTDQLLIIYSEFVIYLRTKGNTIRQCISYLQTSRKQLGGRYCIIFSLSFFIYMKLVRPIKMCLNETCN
jgi:hypothetical protein